MVIKQYKIRICIFKVQIKPRMHAQSFQLRLTFVTTWTITHQAPLSMGFFWQEHWSGLPFSIPGDLPNPRIEPTSPVSPTLQADSLPT